MNATTSAQTKLTVEVRRGVASGQVMGAATESGKKSVIFDWTGAGIVAGIVIVILGIWLLRRVKRDYGRQPKE